jgi:hemoglobin-like flavoprotein
MEQWGMLVADDRENYIVKIPRRSEFSVYLAVASAWATAWPRSYRQIFALVDGQRNTERIAILLHKPPEAVAEILDALLASGYISLRTPRKELLMNASLLRASFDLVEPRKEEFARAFYQRLFAEYPQTRTFFAHTDMKRLYSALAATLAVVVAGAEKGENLVPILRSLGERHVRYGVRPEHYPIVGKVLLETFSDFLGPNWTPAFQETWEQAFEIIAHVMASQFQRS